MSNPITRQGDDRRNKAVGNVRIPKGYVTPAGEKVALRLIEEAAKIVADSYSKGDDNE